MSEVNGQEYEVSSHAPTRISFAGGGTDISPYPETYGGSVLSATISIFMTAQLRLRPDRKVVIRANTRPLPIVYSGVDRMPYDGQLDFVKAIVSRMYRREQGFDLYMYSSLPLRTGLGGSAAMCVAILSAFNHIRAGGKLSPADLAEAAYEIETGDLGNASGRQDQYAAAFGGINLLRFAGGSDVQVEPVDLPTAGRRMLNQALVLFRVGERNRSGEIIVDHAAGMAMAGPQLEAAHATKRLVPEMLQAVMRYDIQGIGELMHELWQQKKRFSDMITTPQIDGMYLTLQQAGMIGGKITGAGGGGHLLACCRTERRHEVITAAEEMGLRPVPFNFVMEGVLSWDSPVRTIMPEHGTYTTDSGPAQ
ncbi:MAG: hypothetical protein LLG01_16135 [Planctomycetaceae bacterium]|nr:hypothetical protein [Planctomycetaceae bacterium]